MALYGGATVVLLRSGGLPLDARAASEHTMVGTLAGTESWFRSRAVVSHFGTGPAGQVRQWQDTRWRAAADGQGNPYIVSIENADTGAGYPAWDGSNVPAMTTQQVDANVLLLGWICRTHRIPARVMTSSAVTQRGIGWHRLGIDPWRLPNTPRWSSSRGKACPGDRRIAQVRALIPRVAALVGAPPPPAVTPPQEAGFLSVLTPAQQQSLFDRVVRIERALASVDVLAKDGRHIPEDQRLARMLHTQLTDDTEGSRTVHDRARRALVEARRVNDRLDRVEALLEAIAGRLEQEA